jgi:hypothetical protein
VDAVASELEVPLYGKEVTLDKIGVWRIRVKVPDAPVARTNPARSFAVMVITARSPGVYVALSNATVAVTIVLPVTVRVNGVVTNEAAVTFHESAR